MEDKKIEGTSNAKKIGFLAGAGVAAAVIYDLAPVIGPEMKGIESWLERVEKSRVSKIRSVEL